MKIKIPKELLAPTESRRYDGTEKAYALQRGPVSFEFKSGVKWYVDITNTGGAFLVLGKVSGSALCQCSRCLEDAEIEVTGDIEGYYLLPGTEDIPSDLDSDEYVRLDANLTIDTEPLISSALLLELPHTPVCSEGCKGLCPKCGSNLNNNPCNCDTSEDDMSANPFAVLKDFDFS